MSMFGGFALLYKAARAARVSFGHESIWGIEGLARPMAALSHANLLTKYAGDMSMSNGSSLLYKARDSFEHQWTCGTEGLARPFTALSHANGLVPGGLVHGPDITQSAAFDNIGLAHVGLFHGLSMIQSAGLGNVADGLVSQQRIIKDVFTSYTDAGIGVDESAPRNDSTGTINCIMKTNGAAGLLGVDGASWFRNEDDSLELFSYNKKKLGILNNKIVYVVNGQGQSAGTIIKMIMNDEKSLLTSLQCAQACQVLVTQKHFVSTDFTIHFASFDCGEVRVFTYESDGNRCEERLEAFYVDGRAIWLAHQWERNITMKYYEYVNSLSLEHNIDIFKTVLWGASVTSPPSDMVGGNIIVALINSEGIQILEDCCFCKLNIHPWALEQATILVKKFWKADFVDGQYQSTDDNPFWMA